MALLQGKMKEGSQYMEISYRDGSDFSQLKIDCQRNPRHSKFIPVSKFSIEHLPNSLKDQEIVDFIRLFASLTVRVLVTKISNDRPKVFPLSDKPYPLYEMKGTNCVRAGSGWVRRIAIFINNGDEPCPCAECIRSGKPVMVWGRIEVPTANHLVFDSEEAKCTQVDLCLVDEASAGTCEGGAAKDQKNVRLNGYTVWYNNCKEDKCWFYCATHDVKLCEKLKEMTEKRDELFQSLVKKYENDKEAQLSIIVSHPHGCGKEISIGEWASRGVNMDAFWWARATYGPITCAGSAGAPVWSLGKKEVEAWRVGE
ncbi:unnamed protein product [Lymnaea stagnalis]|uniref:Uncharacterized protein n=1 Tax=Lymnaea stagnalis TaxID=6523 RepID=A0AAV2I7W7_LYMST